MKLRKPILLATLLMVAVSAASAAEIPSGSHATVRLNTSLSSATAHTGEVWVGTLTHDIAEHGKVIARAGSPVKGKVTYVNRSGRLHKPGALTLRLTSISGETVYSSRVSRQGKRRADWGNCRRRQGRGHWRSGRCRRGDRSCRRHRQAGSQDSRRERSHIYG